MNNIQVTQKNQIKGGGKLKNNKGFSLVELLIVMAIMAVLAVIAFNMFGGVLTNSKKRADDQLAQNIAKAISTYCVDSGDWKLTGAYTDSNHATAANLNTKTPDQLIIAFMTPLYDVNGKEYGPYFSLKDPNSLTTDTVNTKQYQPQWNTSANGKYTGWKFNIYPINQTVDVLPVQAEADEAITISTTK